MAGGTADALATSRLCCGAMRRWPAAAAVVDPVVAATVAVAMPAKAALPEPGPVATPMTATSPIATLAMSAHPNDRCIALVHVFKVVTQAAL